MIKLDVPLPAFTAKTFFLQCVNGYKTQKKRDQLSVAADIVEDDATEYANLVPTQSFTCSSLPGNLTDKDMLNLYENQLVSKKSNNRAYYDAIVNHGWMGRCPYCGVEAASTLDHYLPKSLYPTTVVAPVNLLPCCMRCNHLKLDDDPTPDQAPIHAYLDQFPEGIWLQVDLDAHLEATYRVECPAGWPQLMQDRLKNHMEKFELDDLYQGCAAVEIAESKFLWEEDLQCSEDDLLYTIRRARRSYERVDPNSWRSALYRALENQLPLLVSYLQTKPTP